MRSPSRSPRRRAREPHDGDRTVRHEPGAERGAPAALAVLRGRAALRAEGLHGLQPHALPHPLRRPRSGVLAPAEPCDALGRVGRAPGGDHRPRRLPLHPAPHVPRPLPVRGGPGEVRARDRARRRHRERPGAPSPGREPLLACARRLRRPALRDGARRAGRDGRDDPRAGRLARADSGPEVEGRGLEPVRARDPRASLLLVPRDRPRRDPRGRDAHGVDVRGRVRDLPPRRQPRDGALGADHGGRPSLRHPPHGAVRHPAHRGRDLQPRDRHDDQEQPLRDGARATGRRRHRA